MRHCILNSPKFVGRQIAYNCFADSDYRSRENSLACDTLELVHLVKRVRSSRSLTSPLTRKSPKIVFLDVWFVTHQVGTTTPFNSFSQLENTFQGQLTEPLVGQALIAQGIQGEQQICYWYEDKPRSETEVDFLISIEGTLVSIEVKAGASGMIKSLLSFMEQSSAPLAVKVSSFPLSLESRTTSTGRPYRLLNVPFYLLYRLQEIVRTSL